MRLTVISGRSGSGKTTALQVLEDIGFYCVDNLPIGLLPTLALQIQNEKQSNLEKIAVGVDARNVPSQLEQFPSMLKQIDDLKIDYDIIYLDADDKILLQRFSATRRKHPLSNNKLSLEEAISEEERLLDPIARLSSLSIDTSALSIHDLRSLIKNRVGHKQQDMAILFLSFGFKHGVPADADLVFDMRCLPNPYWEPSLRTLTGKDKEIIDYLNPQENVTHMHNDVTQFLKNWLPKFEGNNRSYMTIAIGCTGGQHRSVYMAERLTKTLSSEYKSIQVRHRELGQR